MRTYSLPNTHLHPDLDYNAFCQCAHEYTGNFYDFIPQDGGRLAISFGDLPATGDVQSINIPCLRALVRGLTSGSREDLSDLARELNGALYLMGPQDLCVPWFYARVDPACRELRYVNAGHESPLLIRHDGAVERLERTGAALGLSTRGVHRQAAIAIEAGDVLAIFSDAVSEDAVVRVVLDHPHAGTAELTRRVSEEARRPTGCQWMGEDRTFVAVRVLGARRHPLFEDCTAESLVMCAA
jgi:serine phosphatase RsbU (regulator of sigma subunit)